MGNTIDTAICLDCTSLMALHISSIKEKIRYVFDTVPISKRDSARFSVIQFRTPNDQPVTTTMVPPYNIHALEQILALPLCQEEYIDDNRDIGKSCIILSSYMNLQELLGAALREVLNLPWRDTDENDVFLEKLAVLITDGVPCGLFDAFNGNDPWEISNDMRNQGITLIVVGVGGSIMQCDDFYCALAHNTGGFYIPFINADRILSSVIGTIIHDQTTFNQVRTHDLYEEIEKNSSFKYSYMKSRVKCMIHECQTMNDIRRFFYDHRLSIQYDAHS
ncbi:unnamed protein product [Adineta ricciae]|uniref:VWFA domain-containing protein n=1 Tax=Adineta ricciae TaxID=249248 RepID=A0A814S7W0_ADIRI|nr:unnamed protein product [Adineta ricciae]CAF1144467.1 unnamed protein product [Adineta ricciae]